jgi:hypothetical protein
MEKSVEKSLLRSCNQLNDNIEDLLDECRRTWGKIPFIKEQLTVQLPRFSELLKYLKTLNQIARKIEAVTAI